jgi:hypothetical protein
MDCFGVYPARNVFGVRAASQFNFFDFGRSWNSGEGSSSAAMMNGVAVLRSWPYLERRAHACPRVNLPDAASMAVRDSRIKVNE